MQLKHISYILFLFIWPFELCWLEEFGQWTEILLKYTKMKTDFNPSLTAFYQE